MHNLPIIEPTRGSMMVPLTSEQTNHWTNNKTDETKPLHIFVLFLGNCGHFFKCINADLVLRLLIVISI